MKIVTLIPLIFLLHGCATFEPKEGMTLREVSQNAYVPCDGYMKKDRDHIKFIKNHPQNPDIKIYNTVALAVYNRGKPECQQDLLFYDSKLISIKTASELIDNYNTPSHAQQGDLFRKSGDAVDSVVKKIESASTDIDESIKNVSTEQKNNSIKSSFDPNTLSVDEIKVYLVGKWGACNDTTQKNGSYMFLDEQKQINSEFYIDGNLTFLGIYSSVEKININNKNLVRITGRIFDYQSEFYKQSKQSRPIQIVWDLGVQESIRVVQRTIWESPEIWPDGGGPRLEVIKDGKHPNGTQARSIERCEVISDDIKDKNLTNSNGNNNFGIKGFVLGASLPKNINIKRTNTVRLADDNVITTVAFETTILEVPFLGTANLLNDKIASVWFFDLITPREFEKKEEYTDFFKRERKLGPLTSYDFSEVSNDLVVLINSSLSNPKGQPKITKVVSDKPLAGICVQYPIWKRLNGDSDKGIETIISSCNFLQKLVESQCRNCKSTGYSFQWKTKATEVEVSTVVPESKDMPFAMNYLFIQYHDRELLKILKQTTDKLGKEVEMQKKKLLDDAKQRDLQMNRARDKKRKNDF